MTTMMIIWKKRNSKTCFDVGVVDDVDEDRTMSMTIPACCGNIVVDVEEDNGGDDHLDDDDDDDGDGDGEVVGQQQVTFPSYALQENSDDVLLGWVDNVRSPSPIKLFHPRLQH